MAQIIIREHDLTSNPASEYTDVAYVPGFLGRTASGETPAGWNAEYFDVPLFFSNLNQFKSVIGDYPAKLTGNGISADVSDEILPATENHFFTDGSVDPGYIYARELLNLGIPVYYEAVGGEVSAEHMYQALAGRNEAVTTKTFTKLAQLSTQGQGITAAVTEIALTSTSNVPQTAEVHDVELVVEGVGACKLAKNDFAIDTNISGKNLTVKVTINTLAKCQVPNEEGALETKPISDYINAGLQVSFNTYDDTSTVVLENIKSVFTKLVDRGTYNVKYLTSGGYPTFEYTADKGLVNGDNESIERPNAIVTAMLKAAGANNNVTDDFNDDPADVNPNGRGDCIAFIDHFNMPSRPLLGNNSVWGVINDKNAANRLVDGFISNDFLSYGAMFTPYAKYNLTLEKKSTGDDKTVEELPGSFAYLTCMAKSAREALPSYESVAGVTRGTVSNIVYNQTINKYEMCPKAIITNYIANQYNIPFKVGEDSKALAGARISINAITQINPYGMVIYGDRTLLPKDSKDGVKATGIINIRNMVSDIKKQVYKAARRYVFNQNTAALWFNFKSMITPLLDRMKGGYGIAAYTLDQVQGQSDDKYAVYAKLNITPVYPVEKFDITINITDTGEDSTTVA